jgi:hypothetical protein
MTNQQRQMFNIPTEQLEAILLTDELLTTAQRVERLEAAGAFSEAYLERAEDKAKADAVRSFYRTYHESERRRDCISVVRKLDDGEEVRGYRKKSEASLEELRSAEADYYSRAHTNWKECIELRSLAKERYDVQIGLPFEFEARFTRAHRRAERAERAHGKTPTRRQPEKSK